MEERPKYEIKRSNGRKDQIQICLVGQWKGDDQFKYIVQKEEKTDQVTHLYLSNRKLTKISMINIGSAKWSSLRCLFLQGNQIGDKGCKFISRVHLPALEVIELGQIQISSIGVSHLSKADWKKLNWIFLDGNKIGFDNIQKINQSNWMQSSNKNEQSSLKIYLQINELFVDQVYRGTLHSFPKELNFYVYENKIEEFYKDKLKCQSKQKKIYLCYS